MPRIRTQPNTSGAHPGDLGHDGIDGNHASNVIGAELGHRSHLVAGKVDDAHERHQVAFASVQQELAQRLVGRKEMMLGVGQNILCKFVVVALHLTERDLKEPSSGHIFARLWMASEYLSWRRDVQRAGRSNS